MSDFDHVPVSNTQKSHPTSLRANPVQVHKKEEAVSSSGALRYLKVATKGPHLPIQGLKTEGLHQTLILRRGHLVTLLVGSAVGL